MSKNRAESAYSVRVSAADLARHRPHPQHKANGDEERYAAAHYPMSFTKGLRHDPDLGVVDKTAHFEAFRHAIDDGRIAAFTDAVPTPMPKDCPRRKWEAPTAGIVYDLQGPDAQAVTMAPAPALCSDENAFEMAEVYELSLLRDVPLSAFEKSGGDGAPVLDASLKRLNAMAYVKNAFHESNHGPRGRTRKAETKRGACVLTRQTAFRGSSPGVENGPYLSQFLWIGTGGLTGADPKDGQIAYGAQCVDQRVPQAVEGVDYMQLWEDWLNVQNGLDVNAVGLGKNNETPGPGQRFEGKKRFIYTPRDLATYVHFDALYQPYLNATLILLGMRTPFDPGFAHLSGGRDRYEPLGYPNPALDDPGRPLNAGGFALFGGPHILSLVTEVATRSLKAVRFQKFNNHLRLRPEALAARMEKAAHLDKTFPQLCGAFSKMHDQICETIAAVSDKNHADVGTASALLPMAFGEGSPMHPTYGAGHATVAGACTTIVKAFFDTGTLLGKRGDRAVFHHEIDTPICYEPVNKGQKLQHKEPECPLTLEGELNKLAANVSIGRNMAGVHYYSDYYDSLRMGEAMAIGMLEEQALCYPLDDFVLSVPTFDGEIVRIGRK